MTEPPDPAGLDFAALRAEVEAATMLPEFDRVARRARRLRRRAQLATVGAVLAVLALLAPAGVVAARDRGPSLGPVANPFPPAPATSDAGSPSASPTPSPTVAPTVTLVAADGVDLDHVYALADVCRGGSCNLQLSQIQSGQQSTALGPDKIGLLRDKPTDVLSGFQLAAMGKTWLVVSARSATAGERVYQRIDLSAVPDDTQSGTAAPGDRVGAIDTTGQLWAADAKTGALRRLVQQPPVAAPAVASTAAGTGLWVTGTDRDSGRLAVSVSQDAGRHWTTRDLGVSTGGDAPVLASSQPQTAYLLTRTADREFALFQTTDGGDTWHRQATTLPWPAQAADPVRYGLVVRPDGSLLAWLATSPGMSYAQSTDGGRTFANVPGPGGPVITLADGYVSLGATPRLSSDGSTWVAARVPTLPVA